MVDRHRLIPHLKEQVTEVVKTLVHKEKPFKKTRKEKIHDLNILKPGDHISFYKTDFYYAHHGIVVEARNDYLLVIHYFNTLENAYSALLKGSIYIAAIIESEWPVNLKSTGEDIYLHHYDNISCFSNEETLRRAYSQLGKQGYSLIGNNCEHWARWCRTGEHYSEQIVKFRSLVKEKAATLLIIDPTALLVKDISLVGARTFGQFLGVLGAGLILTGVESVSAFVDIHKKKNQRKKGSLSDVALKKYVVRRITSASTTVVGGTVGTVVGTILIPVPILGSAIGGTIGSLGGKAIGGISGIALSKILEVHEKMKASKIKKMSTVPLLMANIAPGSDIMHGLMAIALNNQEDEKITQAIEETLQANVTVQSLYPSLDEFFNITTDDKYEKAQEIAADALPDNDNVEYFVLTPLPDINAHEAFASSIDLLVLRWPNDKKKPWESNGEQVLEINDK